MKVHRQIRTIREVSNALVTLWIVLTVLIGVLQFFIYTNESQLEGLTKKVKVSSYVAFTANFLGSSEIINVEPFDTSVSSKHWLEILKNNSTKHYDGIYKEWISMFCSSFFSIIILIIFGIFRVVIDRIKKDEH